MKFIIAVTIVVVGLFVGPLLVSCQDPLTDPSTQSTATTTASTTTTAATTVSSTTTAKPFECTAWGRFANPTDCKKFHLCILNLGGTFTKYDFNCPLWTYYNVYTTFCCFDSNVCTVGSRPKSAV